MTTRVERAAQSVRALELRAQGLTVEQVADELGISLASAHRRIRYALAKIPAESAEEVRRTVETRLDALSARLNRLLESDPSPRDQVAIVAALGNIEKTRMTLLGVAVPPRVVVEHELGDGYGPRKLDNGGWGR